MENYRLYTPNRIKYIHSLVGKVSDCTSLSRKIPTVSNIVYSQISNRKQSYWSLRCSWSIAYRRCSNCIFIMDWTPLFNGLGKGDCKTRRETFQVWYLVRLILDIWRKFALVVYTQMMKIEAFWMVRNTRNFANCAAMACFASFYIQIMIFIIGNRTVRNEFKQWWHNSWIHVCVVCPEWVIFSFYHFPYPCCWTITDLKDKGSGY